MPHDRAGGADLAALYAAQAVAIAAAIVSTLVVTRNGVVVSPDSVAYLSTADRLLNGQGLTTHLGAPLVEFPPAVPIIYAAGSVLPGTVLACVRVANALLFGFAVWLISSFVRRYTERNWVAPACALLSGFGVAVLAVSRAAWSEPWFICALLVFVMRAVALVEAEVWSWRRAGELVLLVWFASMVRYVGIVLAGVVAIAVLFRLASDGRVSTLRRAGLTAVASSALPLFWLLHNLVRHGTPSGFRPPSGDSLGDALHAFSSVIGTWVLPSDIIMLPKPIRSGLGGVVLVVGAATVLWALFALRNARASRVPALVIPLSAAVALSTVLIATQVSTAIDRIGLRLMAPLFPLLMIVGAQAVDAIGLRQTQHVRVPVMTVGVVVVVTQLFAAGQFALDRGAAGDGYSTPMWRDSELVAAVRDLPEHVIVVSNTPDALWYLAGRRRLAEVPRQGHYRSPVSVALPDNFESSFPCEEAVLAWSDRLTPYHHPPERLVPALRTSGSLSYEDGSIWRIEAHRGC